MTDCKECERLKAELAQANGHLKQSRSENAFMSGTIIRLKTELDQAKAENAVLRGDLSKWSATCDESRIGLVLPMPPVVEALCNALEALKSENARLVAVVEWISKQSDLFFAECYQAEAIVARCKEALASTNKQTKE